VLVATTLAESGGTPRFPRLEPRVAYAGVDPSVLESGIIQGKQRHLSKRDPPCLGRVLCGATDSAHRRNPDRAVYLNERCRRKILRDRRGRAGP
jgi:hypothetical protein